MCTRVWSSWLAFRPCPTATAGTPAARRAANAGVGRGDHSREVRPGTRGVETPKLLGRGASAGYAIAENERAQRSALRTLGGADPAAWRRDLRARRRRRARDLRARPRRPRDLRILASLLAGVLTRQTRAHLQ